LNNARSGLLTFLTCMSTENGGGAGSESTLQLFRHTAIGRILAVRGHRRQTVISNRGLLKVIYLRSISKSISIIGMCVFILFYGSVARAENYSWYGHAWSYSYSNIKDPVYFCKSLANHTDISNVRYEWLDSTGHVASPGPNISSFRCTYSHRQWISLQYIDLQRTGNGCEINDIYNHTTGGCGVDEQKGEVPSCESAGNPISLASGNKFQLESDYQASGSSTLNFARSYNARDGLWRHNYSTYLRLDSPSTTLLSLVMADGRESFFTVSGTTVTASPTESGKLVKLTDSWQYTAKNNERFSFDAAGRLTRWTNAAGLEQQLSYSGSTVTVADTLGHSLSFTEDANHQPLSLTANGLQISYSYNANNRLNQLTRTQAGHVEQRSFHYEDSRNPNWLTGITDERGVRYVTWAYDDQGRAISSEHAGGIEHTDVVYNTDGSSTVTNELGKKTTYRFQAIDGIKRVSAIEGEPSAHCPMSNSTFTYDARGLLKTKTDNKGNLTTYTYNTRGQEISRTEAAGTPQARTVTTDWHPTLFLPVTVTEPARITTYTYDAQGRQLSQSVTQR
jgi:YD repeat-containing protein